MCVCVCVTKMPEEQEGGGQIICLIGCTAVLTHSRIKRSIRTATLFLPGLRKRYTRLLSRQSEERLRHRLQEARFPTSFDWSQQSLFPTCLQESNHSDQEGKKSWEGEQIQVWWFAAVPDGGSHQKAEFRGGRFEAHHAKQQDQIHFTKM